MNKETHTSRTRIRGIAMLVGALSVLPAPHAPAATAPPVSTADIRGAVNKVLPLLESSALFTLQERACFTCHHTGHATMAVNEAWSRGFKVDERHLAQQLTRTYAELAGNLPRFKAGRIISGKGDEIGISLWILDVAGWRPDATTAAAAEFLLDHNPDLDHWEAEVRRPPNVGSPFATTFLVLRALERYGAREQKQRITVRSNAAEKWVRTTPSDDTEDRVFRLRTLHLLAHDKQALAAEAGQLLRSQRDDGGWAQLSQMESDAYATSTALAALHDTGILTPRDSAYQKGLQYLLRTQLADGSWHVKKRSHAIQPFFKSGFPHEQDQFISYSATCWAAYALLQTMPKAGPARKSSYLASHSQVRKQLRSGTQPAGR